MCARNEPLAKISFSVISRKCDGETRAEDRFGKIGTGSSGCAGRVHARDTAIWFTNVGRSGYSFPTVWCKFRVAIFGNLVPCDKRSYTFLFYKPEFHVYLMPVIKLSKKLICRRSITTQTPLNWRFAWRWIFKKRNWIFNQIWTFYHLNKIQRESVTSSIYSDYSLIHQ